MDRNVEQRNNSSAVTPAQILQYIEKVYMIWIHKDYGIYYLISQLEELSNINTLFSIKRMKNPDNSDNGVRLYEDLTMYSFDFKGTSKLYHKLGCAKNVIINYDTYFGSLNEMERNIRIPVIELVVNSLDKYKPNFKSQQGQVVYYNFLRNYLYQKIRIVSDVINKKFKLIILK